MIQKFTEGVLTSGELRIFGRSERYLVCQSVRNTYRRALKDMVKRNYFRGGDPKLNISSSLFR